MNFSGHRTATRRLRTDRGEIEESPARARVLLGGSSGEIEKNKESVGEMIYIIQKGVGKIEESVGENSR